MLKNFLMMCVTDGRLKSLIRSSIFDRILWLCFAADLMKVAELTQAKNDETTSADLCSGTYWFGLQSEVLLQIVIQQVCCMSLLLSSSCIIWYRQKL